VQQIEAVLLAQFSEAFDQLFLQAVELIAAFRQTARVLLIFQPDPLEEGRFIQRGRRIGVVLEQPGLAGAVPRQVKARVELLLMRQP